MEDERAGDIRVPLIFSFFCLCVTAGGVFLVCYVFVPSASRPWFPVAAITLIAFPWIFWAFTYLYTCVKPYFRRSAAAKDVRQISRRPTARSASCASSRSGFQSEGCGGGPSAKEPDTPLTDSV